MIALDTNVLLRFIVRDDDEQYRSAKRLVDRLTVEQPGFLTTVVLVEMIWVLSSGYKATKGQLIEVLQRLLNSRELIFENRDAVTAATEDFVSRSVDFADALISHTAVLAGCTETVTFDRAAALNAGMRLLK